MQKPSPMTCYVPDYAQDNRGKCGAHKGGSGVCVKVCNSFSPTLQRLVEIGSWRGRSVAMVPLKTLSMFTAARLYASHRLAPYERRGTHLYEFLVARYHR